MPENKMFIRCRVCKRVLVAVSLINEINPDGTRKDIDDEVLVLKFERLDTLCRNCRQPKKETPPKPPKVVCDIINLFNMGK